MLGYSALDLIGVSWGTRVALETMRRHPGSVRSAILYGPYPPDASRSRGLAARTGPSLERLFGACERDAACNVEFPRLASQFDSAVARLDRNPIRLRTAWGPIGIDGAMAAILISYSLYDSDFLPYVPLAIRELGRGNAGFAEPFLRGAVGEGMSGGTYYAAYCSELAPPIAPDSMGRLHERYAWSDAIDRFAPDETVVCPAFVPALSDTLLWKPVRSAVPTVIFVGEFDPTTPLEAGQRIASTLPNAHLVMLGARGHDVNVPTSCTARIRRAFLDDPRREADTGCANVRQSLTFATRVHTNPGVARLLSRVVLAPDPRWIGAMGAMLLVLLAGMLALPKHIRRAFRAHRHGSALAALVPWFGALLAVAFITFLAVALVAAPDPYLPLFGLEESWRWLFMLPAVVAALSAVAAIAVTVAWTRAWWTPGARVIATITAVGCIAFAALAIASGLLELRAV